MLHVPPNWTSYLQRNSSGNFVMFGRLILKRIGSGTVAVIALPSRRAGACAVEATNGPADREIFLKKNFQQSGIHICAY
jgi:hypothetical protein